MLGMEDEIGSLEVGKQADFLVIQPQGKIHLQPQETCCLTSFMLLNQVMLMTSTLQVSKS